MEYGLPKRVKIQGRDYTIRYDYRAVLDIFEALNEMDASEWDRIHAALLIFYPEFEELPEAPYYTEAIQEMFKFINGGKGENSTGRKPQLVSWERDFPYLCAAVNRVLGYEIRSVPYDHEHNEGGVHWYTFLAGYMEIGDCLFSQIVGIRSKKARNQKLDKAEQQFYKQNRALIDLPSRYGGEELEMLKQWL